MSKLAKQNGLTKNGKKTKKNQIKKIKKGRIDKKLSNGKDTRSKKLNGLGKRKKNKLNESINSQYDENDDKDIIKKKPSKAELKIVIDGLKKDPTMLMLKKALKYVPFYLKSEGLTKKLLKEIIRLWAEAGEKIRVVCLLCLIRIYNKVKDKERKQDIIKKLYTSFLDKCRITKHETMSMIGFMRHSLIELYKIDPDIAFKQAQTACQQLTITLKNATVHKNEETYKSILNWQFANCLILLSNLIISQEGNSPVKSLTHQVIQLNLGAIAILSSPRYYPYYCHLIENLIILSISTKLFIPVLPLMINIVERIQIPIERKNEKNKKGAIENEKKKKSIKGTNMNSDNSDESGNSSQEKDSDDGDDEGDSDEKMKVKEYNMELLNHVSLDEAHCKEYQHAVLDKIHELMVRYLASQCHKIAFPELVLLPCVHLKKWLKRNPGPTAQKFKILLEKIKLDCEKLESDRKSINFAFTNFAAVDAWEKRIKDSNKLSLLRMA